MFLCDICNAMSVFDICMWEYEVIKACDIRDVVYVCDIRNVL